MIDASGEKRNVGNGPTESPVHKAHNGFKMPKFRAGLGVHGSKRYALLVEFGSVIFFGINVVAGFLVRLRRREKGKKWN